MEVITAGWFEANYGLWLSLGVLLPSFLPCPSAPKMRSVTAT